jgi:hypothetical protein
MLSKEKMMQKRGIKGFYNVRARGCHSLVHTRLALAVQADVWPLPVAQEEHPAQAVVVVVPDFQVDPTEHAAQDRRMIYTYENFKQFEPFGHEVATYRCMHGWHWPCRPSSGLFQMRRKSNQRTL